MNRDSIQQSVLERIREGQVHRRPRAYFVLRVALSVLLALVAFVLSAFVVSLVLFDLHESGEQFLLGFGMRGVLVFLGLFPWLYAVLDLLLLAVLGYLLRGFKVGYRSSVLVIFAGLLVASAAAGAGIAATPLHGALFHRERAHGLPAPVGGLYSHVLDPHDAQGVFRGVVTSVGSSTLTMAHDDLDRDRDDGAYHVLMPPGWDPATVRVGERLLVFGHADAEGIQAERYQELPGLDD